MATVTIRVGDCIEQMRQMESESVHCCVTSPPYFGLRDYGVAGQHGLEASIDEYLDTMVRVFAEVRRVLRKDGTLWLNLGDSYGSSGRSGRQNLDKLGERLGTGGGIKHSSRDCGRAITPPGLKQKDLLGIPWRVAFALQADGWYLRQDIIWHKPNPMPESVKDRCTKAHEYIFLLSKSSRYYFDRLAIQEKCGDNTHPRRASTYKTPDGWDTSKGKGAHGTIHRSGREKGRKLAQPGDGVKNNTNNTSFDEAVAVMPEKRNKRTVWTVAPKPYKGAHFATFPPALIEPCVLAGAPKGGIVLDPYAGSGTTGQVALRHGRSAILCELNPEYVKLAEQRLGFDLV